jgi:hypothetical protein
VIADREFAPATRAASRLFGVDHLRDAEAIDQHPEALRSDAAMPNVALLYDS